MRHTTPWHPGPPTSTARTRGVNAKGSRKNKIRWLLAPLLALVAVGLTTPPVRAGGIVRPNIIGARPVGMAGAYAALADDSLSIWHNPAGLARMHHADMAFGFELAFILRRYRPPGGSLETASATPSPLPLVTGGARLLVGKNSFIALGLGIYNSFGGAVTFKKSKVTEGVIKTQIALFEVAPTLAYQVSDKIFIGASLRVGIGFFSALKSCSQSIGCYGDDSSEPLYDTQVDTLFGGGAGYSLGIQVLPVSWLGLGLVYRSSLTVRPSGQNALHSLGQSFDAHVRLPFPQMLSFGVFTKVGRAVTLAAQVDWVDNSRFKEIFIESPGLQVRHEEFNTPLYMRDSFAIHLGGEFHACRHLVLRAGMAYDSQSIPNRYRRRELEDANKLTWNLGASVILGRWRIDLATELMLGDVTEGFKSVVFPDDYAAPGRHFPGGTFSLHLGGGVRW